MITANEFRLGNLIQSDGEVFTIDSISEDIIHAGALGIYRAGFVEDYGIELTPEWLERFGFEKLPHFTITDSMMIQIRGNRYLSVQCVGTPNAMAFLQEFNGDECTDLICIHNYDYHGRMMVHQLQNLFFALTGRELELKK